MDSLQTSSRGRLAARVLKLGTLFMTLGIGAMSLSACQKEQPDRQYCDNTGCYQCQGDRCYPVPGDPAKPDPTMATTCSDDATCGSGRLCNLGRCEASCTADSNCQSGYACVAGRCRPSGASECGVAGAFCTDSKQCGAGAQCKNRACLKECQNGACGLGQACQDGLCVSDPTPNLMTAQCLYDYDCAVKNGGDAARGGFRCVNSYCMPRCGSDAACAGTGLSCVKGVCRSDQRAVSG